MNYMQGKFNALFQSQIPQNKLWEFLAVLAVNINGNSKRSMLAELRFEPKQTQTIKLKQSKNQTSLIFFFFSTTK